MKVRRHRSGSRMKSEPGPPMTLGSAAAAGVRLIVWCWDCRHQVEPDPAEHSIRYGPQTAVLDWKARLVCAGCCSRDVGHGGKRDPCGRGGDCSKNLLREPSWPPKRALRQSSQTQYETLAA